MSGRVATIVQIMVALSIGAASAGCTGKTRIVDVSTAGVYGSVPIIRGAENTTNLHIAWVEQPISDPAATQVVYRRVHVTTSPMGPRIPLGAAEAGQLQPLAMAVSNQFVYVAYTHWPAGTPAYDVYLAASHDAGASFRPAINVSRTGTEASLYPQVTASGANVHMLWREQTASPGSYEVRARASSDGGQTFGASDTLTSVAPDVPPQIAIFGGDVYAMYCERPGIIFVTHKPIGGGSWSPPQRLTSANATSQCGKESLTASTSLYAIWIEVPASTNYDTVMVKRSTGGAFVDAGSMGSTWRIRGPLRADAFGDEAYIAYEAITDPNYDHSSLFFTRTHSATSSLAAPRDVSGATLQNPISPQLSAGGDYIGVVWRSSPHGWIVFAQPYYVGNQDIQGHQLRNASGDGLVGLWPDVHASGGDYYVVWRNAANQSGAQNIYLYSRRAWRMFE